MTAIGFPTHDHSNCIADALKAAEILCADRKLQFTPVRRRVLEILLQGHRALGAYGILANWPRMVSVRSRPQTTGRSTFSCRTVWPTVSNS